MKKNLYGKTIALSLFAALAIAFAPTVSDAASQSQAKLNTIKASHLANLRTEVLKNSNRLPKNLQPGPATSWMRRVNNDEVNMVTNRLEKNRQDAIRIDGKTYYGTGEGYALTLQKNHSLTHATDPYTGNRIDKADAQIFADASGNAYYFESAESYSAFISLAGDSKASLNE